MAHHRTPNLRLLERELASERWHRRATAWLAAAIAVLGILACTVPAPAAAGGPAAPTGWGAAAVLAGAAHERRLVCTRCGVTLRVVLAWREELLPEQPRKLRCPDCTGVEDC